MEKMGKLRAQKHNWRHMIIFSFIFYVIVGENEALVNKIDVLVNDMVSLNCHTNPSIDIQWHFNSLLNYVFAGGKLWYPYAERLRTEDDNAGHYILIIPRVRSEDAGWYYCSEEETGRRISSTHLTVLYSQPICYSNMHPDGYIGPNTCNLEQENMIFNCAVSFNASFPPHLMWRSLNDNRTINSLICEDKPNRRNCSLIMTSDPKYDGYIFICQTTASIGSSFNCSTEAIKILHFSSTKDTTVKYVNVNDNVNCTATTNLNVKYKWALTEKNRVEFLSSNHNLKIQDPGSYQCEVNYNIRNYSCLFRDSVIIASVKRMTSSVMNLSGERTNTWAISGITTMAIVIPIVLVLLGFSAGIIMIIIWQRKRRQRLYPIPTSSAEDNEVEGMEMAATQDNERIKDKVVSMYIDFTSEVDPKNVFDLLIQSGIVSIEDKQRMMNKDTAKERCRALIDHLFLCSKENAFIVLREALKKSYPKIGECIDASDADNVAEDETVTDEGRLDNERIRNRVVAIYEEFVSEVDPKKKVLDFLIQNKIVNIKQRHHLTNKATTEEQCEALLDLLYSCSKDNVFIILKEALKEHYPGIVERIDSLTIDDEDQNNPNRKSTMRLESSIIVFRLDDAFKIHLNRSDDVSALQQLPIEVNHYTAAAVYCGSVFVTGIGKDFDELWRFDARNSKWNKCTSLIRGRSGHSVAFVDHILYICGGWRSDDVEAYDAIDDKCSVVGKLIYAVRDAGNCLPYKASLYIFGGSNTQREKLNSVQVYNTKFNSCTLLTNSMPRNEELVRAALLKNYAILLGVKSCFMYNFDTETWEVRDQFKTDVEWFGTTYHNEKLFVIGGRDSDDVRYVPIVNILNDELIEWKHHAKLPKPFGVYAFAKMEFLVKQI